jgi:hypothetical protein
VEVVERHPDDSSVGERGIECKGPHVVLWGPGELSHRSEGPCVVLPEEGPEAEADDHENGQRVSQKPRKVRAHVTYSGTMLLLTGLNLLLAGGVAYLLRQLVLGAQPSGLLVANYRGMRIAAVGGIVLAATLVVVHGADALGVTIAFGVGGAGAVATSIANHFYSEETIGIVITAMGFFVFGILDDLFTSAGGPRARGFKGHLESLRRGVVTSGIIKLVGGGATALIASAFWSATLAEALLDAAIVALSANLLNLLDLRPGRATKVFLLWWIPLAIVGGRHPFLTATVAIAVAAVVWLPSDLQERGMLGDSGANLLGAIAGAGLALLLPVFAEVIALIVLVFLTVASEFVSFSSVIKNTAPLAWFDRLGRVYTENHT